MFIFNLFILLIKKKRLLSPKNLEDHHKKILVTCVFCIFKFFVNMLQFFLYSAQSDNLTLPLLSSPDTQTDNVLQNSDINIQR